MAPVKRKKRKPYRPRDALVTSRIMSRVRSKNTTPELLLRKELWRRGFRYRLHGRGLPGSPDLVFRRYRTVVFVDGDHWHGRAYLEGGARHIREVFRGTSRNYWIKKIKGNIRRDRRVNAALRAMNWTVIRVWERDVRSRLDETADHIGAVLSGGRTKQGVQQSAETDSR